MVEADGGRVFKGGVPIPHRDVMSVRPKHEQLHSSPVCKSWLVSHIIVITDAAANIAQRVNDQGLHEVETPRRPARSPLQVPDQKPLEAPWYGEPAYT